jgi:arsenate reductase (glutaredoxin)
LHQRRKIDGCFLVLLTVDALYFFLALWYGTKQRRLQQESEAVLRNTYNQSYLNTMPKCTSFAKLKKKGGSTMIQFYAYPKCSTCRSAKKWLDANGADYEAINIAETPPSAEELQKIHQASGLELKKFFNTSGQKYRELGLKDKLAAMSEQEQLQLLASDGMLIKRPLAFDGTKATLGFKEADYENTWK